MWEDNFAHKNNSKYCVAYFFINYNCRYLVNFLDIFCWKRYSKMYDLWQIKNIVWLKAPGNRTPLKIMILSFLLKYIGFFAAFCTTFAFFPQAVKVWKTKSTKDISLYMFIIFTTGVFSWLIYGIIISDLPIILANALTLVLSLFILIFKLKYK